MDLAKLERLNQINLSANPCQEVNFYRDNLFMTLPKIKVLDGFDKNWQIVEEVDQKNYKMEDFEEQCQVILKAIHAD